MEKIHLDGLIRVCDGKDTHPYSRERLLLSIIRASDKMQLPTGTVTELTSTVEECLRQKKFFGKPSQDKILISDTATEVLARYDKNLGLQYLNQIYNNQPPLERINEILQT